MASCSIRHTKAALRTRATLRNPHHGRACCISHTLELAKASPHFAEEPLLGFGRRDLLCLVLRAIICSQVFWTIIHQAWRAAVTCACSKLCRSCHARCSTLGCPSWDRNLCKGLHGDTGFYNPMRLGMPCRGVRTCLQLQCHEQGLENARKRQLVQGGWVPPHWVCQGRQW